MRQNNKKHITKWILTLIVGTSMFPITFTNFKNQTSLNSPTNSFYSRKNYNSIPLTYRNNFYPDINKENICPDDYNKEDITLDRFRYVYYSDNTYIDCYDYQPFAKEYKYRDYSVYTQYISQSGFAHIANDESDEYANTFLEVFANNIDVANYFSLGNPNKKCTKQSIYNFLESDQGYLLNKTINLSSLYENDLGRDNSVLALLNPQLWDCILQYGKENTNYAIKGLDLSHNKLRIIPNIASLTTLRSNYLWMFEDGINGMVHRQKGYPSSDKEYSNGYLDFINLSHNELTYVPSGSYIKPYEIEEKKQKGESFLYPGLANIVKKVKDDTTEIGVMIDYNHMPYLTNLNQHLDGFEKCWWDVAAFSWYTSGFVFTSSTLFDYMKYTIWKPTDAILSGITYLVGFGLYQTDAITLTEKEISNYIKSDEKFYSEYKNILPSEMKKSDKVKDKIQDIFIAQPFTSVPVGVTIYNLLSYSSIACSLQSLTDNNYDGELLFGLFFPFTLHNYLSNDIKIDLSQSTTQIMEELLKYINLNKTFSLKIEGFKKQNWLTLVYCLVFIPLIITIIGIVCWRFAISVRRRNRYHVKAREGKENE